MNKKVKIFCQGEEQKEIAEKYKVTEQYDGFILAEVSEREKENISQKYPVEDITDLYTLRAGEKVIDTSIPRIEATGKVSSHPAYKGVKPLSAGRHHYLVQFVGPIKNEWLNKIKQAGGEPRVPFANFAYVIRADDRILKKIAVFSFVRWIGHLPHHARITPSVLKHAGRKSDDVFSDLPRTRIIPGAYVVEFFGSDDVTKAISQVKKAGVRILETNPNGKMMVVEISGTSSHVRKGIESLAAVHGVCSIRERSIKRTSVPMWRHKL